MCMSLVSRVCALVDHLPVTASVVEVVPVGKFARLLSILRGGPNVPCVGPESSFALLKFACLVSRPPSKGGTESMFDVVGGAGAKKWVKIYLSIYTSEGWASALLMIGSGTLIGRPYWWAEGDRGQIERGNLTLRDDNRRPMGIVATLRASGAAGPGRNAN